MGIWLDARGADPELDLRSVVPGKTIAVAGVYDGLSARLAMQAGFKALYLSGAGLSASMALPDLGLLTLEDVVRAARTVVRASSLPVIVDCDTGFGEALNVMRTVRELEEVGVSCIQIEDQQMPKKCGHLNDKRLISITDMCAKIAAARKASSRLAICARTDAVQESLDQAIYRAKAYRQAGADIIFVEALRTVDEIRRVRSEIDAPLLANMTEFGRTPSLSVSKWEELGFELVIFPVSALRVTAGAIKEFYASLQKNGDASEYLPKMMTRAQLYDHIGYFEYEELDSKIARTRMLEINENQNEH